VKIDALGNIISW